MKEMYPFKKRYLLLSIPVIIIVCICILRTNMKYEKVTEYRYNLGEEFDFSGMNISVKEIRIVEDNYIEEKYADNPMVMSIYESSYKKDGVIMATLDVKGINDDLYKKIIGKWQMVTGVKGKGVGFMTDFANGEFSEEKEDREIALFFGIYSEELKECDYKVMLRSQIYPDQHIIEVDLNK